MREQKIYFIYEINEVIGLVRVLLLTCVCLVFVADKEISIKFME